MEYSDIPPQKSLAELGYDAFGQSPLTFFGIEENKKTKTLNEAGLPSNFIIDNSEGWVQRGQKQVLLNPGQDIQAALDAVLKLGGGTVSLQPGTYMPRKDLYIGSGVVLEGAGFANTFIDFDGGAYSVHVEGENAYSTGTVTTVKSSTTITGSGTAWTDEMVDRVILVDGNYYYVVSVASATSLTVDVGIATEGASGLAYVIADFNTGTRIENLTITNSSVNLLETRYAIIVTLTLVDLSGGVIGWNVQDTFSPQFINCNAYNGQTGIKLTNCYFYTFTTWFVFNCSSHGVILDTGGNSTFTDFSVSNCGGVGIHMTDTTWLAMLSATIDSHGSHGIEQVSGCSSIGYNNVTFDGNTGDGLKLTATSDKVLITQNEFSDNGGYGINIANANCDNNIILGNIFENNTTAAATDSGTGTVIRSNSGLIDN